MASLSAEITLVETSYYGLYYGEYASSDIMITGIGGAGDYDLTW